MMFFLVASLLRIGGVLANTEKVVFLGPESLSVPIEHPTLEDLHLYTLSPQLSSLRTHIKAEFPSKVSQNGQPSWVLLTGLQQGQRYEIRICWAATEPTSFRLNTYTLPEVLENPELITSLAAHSESRQTEIESLQTFEKPTKSKRAENDATSNLLLHIQAAADYYTMNKTLMNDVPPVYIEMILDPFIFNAVPRSLISTAAYIILLAIVAWQLSTYINKWIGIVAIGNETLEKKRA